jgi:hypothetical protein
MTLRFDIARQIASGLPVMFRPPAEASTPGPGSPPLQMVLYQPGRGQALNAPTRSVLDQAASPQEWGALFLSSPEFMRR